MWYVAELLFAQLPKERKRTVKCETSDVLFEGGSALEVYDKALRWAEAHTSENSLHFVGVAHISPLDDTRPDDGSEVGGSFFDARAQDVWERRDSIIPPKEKIPIIMFEQNRHTPIGQLLTAEQRQDFIQDAREILGEEWRPS